jgi:hypothetical protein
MLFAKKNCSSITEHSNFSGVGDCTLSFLQPFLGFWVVGKLARAEGIHTAAEDQC